MHLVSFLNSNEAGELGDDGEVDTQLNDVILEILLHNLTYCTSHSYAADAANDCTTRSLLLLLLMMMMIRGGSTLG